MKSTNITRVVHLVDEQERWRRQGHRGGVVWMTGLPASGKKSIAYELETRLFEAEFEAYAFDSARIRLGLSSNLGFDREDRRENIRRAGELAAIMARSGLVVIAAFISPYQRDREAARSAADNFHEVFLDVPPDVCEARDDQGRYARARTGELADFTGVSAPYERPTSPELVLDGAALSQTACVDQLVAYVERHFRFP
ncbi:MAG: adenylyl-sulfate kinase [Rhodospirillaceae bacterium]|jgi:adenylyl-sulfate kinase|nr:adenylyl-sulfate kinase [Rhodospirillaceae bacterium]